MDQKLNYTTNSDEDHETKTNEAIKRVFAKNVWRQRSEKFNRKKIYQLSENQRFKLEHYTQTQLAYHHERDEILVNDICNGHISFAYEHMEKFSWTIVDLICHDVTYLDLSHNNIKKFDFLRKFQKLKSLIVDENVNIDINTLPEMCQLELFYANKCRPKSRTQFVLRITVIFPNLKYLSLMSIPISVKGLINPANDRQHKLRMMILFLNPNLVHVNDKSVEPSEIQHAIEYHQAFVPSECKRSKCDKVPDPESIRKLIPVYSKRKIRQLWEVEQQRVVNEVENCLSSITISPYLFDINDRKSISIRYVNSNQKNHRNDNVLSLPSDEGIDIMSSSDLYFD